VTQAATRSVWWYALAGLIAPRGAARTLLGEPAMRSKSWALVWAGAAAAAAASAAVALLAFNYFPDRHDPSGVMLGDGAQGILLDSLLYGLVTALSFPVVVFIWKSLFNYKAQAGGVFAATALGMAILPIVSPLQELIYLWMAKIPENWQFLLFGVNVAVILGLTSIYYSEALSIGYGRALALNLAATAIIIAILALVAVLLAAIYSGGPDAPIGIIGQ
jgi:hypothetical protein